MLDFFLTRVKGLFSAPESAPKVSKKKSKPDSKSPTVSSPATDDKNRVVFAPGKTTPAKTISQTPKQDLSQVNAQIQASLQNTKKNGSRCQGQRS